MSKKFNVKALIDYSADDLSQLVDSIVEDIGDCEKPYEKISDTNYLCPHATKPIDVNACVCDRELISLNALIMYIADETNISEPVILECLKGEYGIRKLSELPSSNYRDAIKYLVDLSDEHKLTIH